MKKNLEDNGFTGHDDRSCSLLKQYRQLFSCIEQCVCFFNKQYGKYDRE